MKQRLLCLILLVLAVLCSVSFLAADGSYKIKLGDEDVYTSKQNVDYFVKNIKSSEYSPEFSALLMALSCSVHNRDNVADSYKALGFENVECKNYYDDPYALEYGENNCAFAIGSKSCGKDTIVLVTVRGSYGPMASERPSPDWQSNFDYTVTENGNHNGFEITAQNIKNFVYEYLKNADCDAKNCKFVITGHSRGAAVANLLCKFIEDDGTNQSDIYGYTFASPDVTVNRMQVGNYQNIFNLCNTQDIVALMPRAATNPAVQFLFGMSSDDKRFDALNRTWHRYGTTLWFTKDSGEPYMMNGFDVSSFSGIDFNAHSQKCYLDKAKSNASKYEYDLGECNVQIELNGKAVICDCKPVISDGRTLVPLRAISEATGAEVSWEQETSTAYVKKDGFEIKVKIGENVMYKNSEKIALDVPSRLVLDRTMIPLRAVAEALDLKVDWDADTYTVIICK